MPCWALAQMHGRGGCVCTCVISHSLLTTSSLHPQGGCNYELKFRTNQLEHKFGFPYQIGHHEHSDRVRLLTDAQDACVCVCVPLWVSVYQARSHGGSSLSLPKSHPCSPTPTSASPYVPHPPLTPPLLLHPAQVEDCDLASFHVHAGDIIVMGSDGLLDNIAELDIMAEVCCAGACCCPMLLSPSSTHCLASRPSPPGHLPMHPPSALSRKAPPVAGLIGQCHTGHKAPPPGCTPTAIVLRGARARAHEPPSPPPPLPVLAGDGGAQQGAGAGPNRAAPDKAGL